MPKPPTFFMVEACWNLQFPILKPQFPACGVAALHQPGAPAQAAHGQVHGITQGLGAQAGS